MNEFKKCPISVVIATRDRRERLLDTLERLVRLPEQPAVIVVDNASRDGTVSAVRENYPQVRVEALEENLGVAARNIGVDIATSPLVAFCDDDSWWRSGSLAKAAALFSAYPNLGLLAARILVEPESRLDPLCEAMRASPLSRDAPLPGPPVLGFAACGAVVRREAFQAVGGFPRRYQVGGEERLLAIDLACEGWDLCYVDEVVVHHDPPRTRARPEREAMTVRNDLWTAWLRRPMRLALARTLKLVPDAIKDAHVRRTLWAVLQGLPWALSNRRAVLPAVESRLRLLERG
jgi:GT2 family glycosyltransferase